MRSMYLVYACHELCRLLRDRIPCKGGHDDPTEENGDDSREAECFGHEKRGPRKSEGESNF